MLEVIHMHPLHKIQIQMGESIGVIHVLAQLSYLDGPWELIRI